MDKVLITYQIEIPIANNKEIETLYPKNMDKLNLKMIELEMDNIECWIYRNVEVQDIIKTKICIKKLSENWHLAKQTVVLDMMQKFTTDNYKKRKFKEWGLSTKLKEFRYYPKIKEKNYVNCIVNGYIDDNELVISTENEVITIMPEFLAQMQTGHYEPDLIE